MIQVRKASERGHENHGWLDSWHTFSFADFYDPQFMGFRSLRVINEDTVTPGAGFPTHPHRNMEIISYVLEGALAHRDSTGSGSTMRPGEVQRMSAGSGVTHSEFNASKTDRLRFLQIWILPERPGIVPGYEQRAFPEAQRRGRLRLVAARDGRDGALTIHQDAELYASLLEPGQTVEHRLAPGRHGWVQVARGAVRVNGTPLLAGDGAAISDEPVVKLAADEAAELLLFDLA